MHQLVSRLVLRLLLAGLPVVRVQAFAETPTAQAPQAVMTINGYEVSRDEFQWFMEQERSAVFRALNNAARHADSKVSEQNPQETDAMSSMLRSNTLARVVREKAEQIVFHDLGLLQDISYAGFRSQLDRVNHEREQAAGQGRAVYGPVRYHPLQFYEHRKATLRVQAIQRLTATNTPPGETDLRRFYDDHLELFSASPTYTMDAVTIKAKRPGTDSAAAMQSAARNILDRAKAGASLTNLVKAGAEHALLTVSGQRFVELSADRLGELFSSDEQLAQVTALAPGEAILLPERGSAVMIVMCRSKNPGGPRAYDKIQQQLRERWQEQLYSRHLDEFVRRAEVTTNNQAAGEIIR
jgi:hypothetical protein